jgi:class 3 adenylate cyclase/tetratricopeptide (TPR) repeat protein
MRCSRCRHENEPDAVFCEECAAPLIRACSNCGRPLSATAKFCPACAHPTGLAAGSPPLPRFGSPESYTPRYLAERILTSKASLEGERKQVTVLFVDVSGFTSLSARLDPEDVHRVMQRGFELMLAEVHRFEGTVNQFLGDGIMALFGAPIAHEDHAQRAVHAALGIRQALQGYRDELRGQRGIEFQARMGLNTGLVVVGSIGDDLRMDYTAVGDTTNVAARMQQAADPGRILVSEATHRLVGGYFDTRPIGALALKGKAEPVGAWEVVAARGDRARIDVSEERGLTAYVGREYELAVLQECFERAKGGHGQVVFVVGEPGIGKSRLLYEFRRRLGDEATWLEGRCISFGQAMALHPVIDMLKRTFRIEEGDAEEEIGRKIDRAVLQLGEDLRPLLPYLRYVLSVDPGDPQVAGMDPQGRRGEIFDALRRLLVRASEVRPQVFVQEDVHWMDKATEESLLFLADSIPTNRVLHIVTYRSGWAHPFGERSYHTRLALGTLSGADSVGMARAILATDDLPPELRALIIRKAEGNPFFIEEVVKSLHEIGALRREGDRYVLSSSPEGVVIPDTIQGIIMARIDRLADAPKRTLQLASVIGREFTRRLLERISEMRDRTDEFLRELKAIELIYEKNLFPELAYMFKHALTHEVAYGSLLVQRRRELHHAIARAVEELYPNRLAEHYEVLAYHFCRAEEWPKALEYLLKAAQKAAQAFANREAVALYAQAVEAMGHLGGSVDARTRLDVYQAQLGIYTALSEFDRAIEAGERAAALAREMGDRGSEAGALAGLGFAATWGHRFDAAVAYAGRAVDIGAAAGTLAPVGASHVAIGQVMIVTRRLEEGRAHLEDAHEIGRRVGDAATQAIALGAVGILHNWAGEYRRAVELESESLRLARELNQVVPLALALWQSSLPLIGQGGYDEARAVLEEGLVFCEKAGEQVMALRMANTLGWLWMECGDMARAAELSARAAEGARKRGDPETIANPELNLADIFIARGDLALAGEVLEGVQALVKAPTTSEWMRWRYSTHLFASLADLAVARGDHRAAVTWADQCLGLAVPTQSRRYVVRGLRVRAQVAMGERRWDAAEQALGEALTVARVMGNPTQLWRTHLELARLHAARGRGESAQAERQEAARVVEERRERALDTEIRGALASLQGRIASESW